MGIEDKYDQVMELIALGKEKGYLLYDEVNELLPSDIRNSEEIEDILATFGTEGIEVIEESPKLSPDGKMEAKLDDAGEDAELDLSPGSLEKTNDPVRVYLREMGIVPLLTRDGATAAGLVNELVEAKHQLQLRRVLTRWSRYELLALDEVGYVPMADVGAEFLFQVIAERAEKAAVVLTTNLPFSEWTQVIPNARLCKALLDRITDRAHIIETGTESYRFRRTLERKRKS